MTRYMILNSLSLWENTQKRQKKVWGGIKMIIGIFIGLVIGCCFGFLLAGLLTANKEDK